MSGKNGENERDFSKIEEKRQFVVTENVISMPMQNFRKLAILRKTEN